ncbi:hypothetical protein D3C81_1887480 [compost metagenome]
MTIINENCSTGTLILDSGDNSFSRPCAKVSGFVVNVKIEASKMNRTMRQTKRDPLINPSIVTSRNDQDQITVPFVNNTL